MGDDTTRRQSNGIRWLTWVLWGLALAGLLYLAGLTAWLGIAGLLFPYQLDYGEGVMLHFVREWAAGRPIYIPIDQYPYATANYAPLTLLLALALKPLLGLSYAAGRLWTLLAVAAVAVLVAAWVRRVGGRWLPALVAALLFAGSPYVYHWAPLFRVDLIGLALTLGGLYAVYVAISTAAEAKRWGWLLGLAVVLFVAGLYAKQSFLFAPAAALATLFLFVDRRAAIALALAIGALGGGLFLAINALTGGGFWEGLVVSNVNRFLWPEFWQQQADFIGTFAVLGLLSAWYVVDKCVLDRARPWAEKVSPLDLYLPAALASLLLAGKAGAWENYFFEGLVALVLCGGLGLAKLQGRGTLGLVAPLLVLAQVALMWHTPRVAEEYLELTRRSNEEMAPVLARTRDPLFSEDMGLLVTHDKVMDYYSFQYSQLARAGRWDQAWELGQLRDRRRSMVILEQGTRLDVDRYGRFTRQFLSELDHSYGHTRTVGKYELYVPDPLQHEQQVEFGGQLALVGWSLHAPPVVEAGDTFSLTVVWQALGALDTDYAAFAHLVDGTGQGWAGDDHQPYGGLYPTSAWGAGEMVRDSYTLAVPDDAPPGLYDVRVGWYEPATQVRLPTGGGDSVRVAVVPVDWTGTGSQDMVAQAVPFGQAIILQGAAWRVDGSTLEVTLRWAARGYVDADYSVFVHLVPAGGDQAVAQGDAPPLGGRWPTSLWGPGIVLDDSHTVVLPEDLPPGTYDLLVGLYDPRTGARLPLPDGNDALRLTGIELP